MTNLINPNAIRVGMHDAKTRLALLIAWAHDGEEVILTRHGKPVAMVVPIQQQAEEQQPKEAQHDDQIPQHR